MLLLTRCIVYLNVTMKTNPEKTRGEQGGAQHVATNQHRSSVGTAEHNPLMKLKNKSSISKAQIGATA